MAFICLSYICLSSCLSVRLTDYHSVMASVRASIGISAGCLSGICHSVCQCICHAISSVSIRASLGVSIAATVGVSVETSLGASVSASVRVSVRVSVRATICMCLTNVNTHPWFYTSNNTVLGMNTYQIIGKVFKYCQCLIIAETLHSTWDQCVAYWHSYYLLFRFIDLLRGLKYH